MRPHRSRNEAFESNYVIDPNASPTSWRTIISTLVNRDGFECNTQYYSFWVACWARGSSKTALEPRCCGKMGCFSKSFGKGVRWIGQWNEGNACASEQGEKFGRQSCNYRGPLREGEHGRCLVLGEIGAALGRPRRSAGLLWRPPKAGPHMSGKKEKSLIFGGRRWHDTRGVSSKHLVCIYE